MKKENSEVRSQKPEWPEGRRIEQLEGNSTRDWVETVMLATAAIIFVVLTLLFLTGCTVRGGWPRFLRPGEASGWHAPAPATNAMIDAHGKITDGTYYSVTRDSQGGMIMKPLTNDYLSDPMVKVMQEAATVPSSLFTNQLYIPTTITNYAVEPPNPATAQMVESDIAAPMIRKALVAPTNRVSVPLGWDLPQDDTVTGVSVYVDTTPGNGRFSATEIDLLAGTNATLFLADDKPSYITVTTRTAPGAESLTSANECLFVPANCPLYDVLTNQAGLGTNLMSVVWYGRQGTIYTLQGMSGIQNPEFRIQNFTDLMTAAGTNGPLVYTEPPLAQNFFRLRMQ